MVALANEDTTAVKDRLALLVAPDIQVVVALVVVKVSTAVKVMLDL